LTGTGRNLLRIRRSLPADLKEERTPARNDFDPGVRHDGVAGQALAFGSAPISRSTYLNAARTSPGPDALNDNPNRLVNFLYATDLQQPFRETDVVVEGIVHDAKAMRAPAPLVVDLRTRDLGVESL
jgi:hypothetical protein